MLAQARNPPPPTPALARPGPSRSPGPATPRRRRRHPGTIGRPGGGPRVAEGAISFYCKAKGRWGEGGLETSLLKLR